MTKIRFYNRIADAGLAEFQPDRYLTGPNLEDPDGILVRSESLHALSFGPGLKAIARAGAGVNNIPLKRCTEQGIVVFNTPGANANSVKELTLCALLLAARDISGGIDWVKTLPADENLAKRVEAGKGAFAGVELYNRTLGVIGLGAVGGQVANVAHQLGMTVIGYDPYLSVDGAWRLSRGVAKASDLEELLQKSDFITLHLPSTPDTRGLINATALAAMKKGVRLINTARADLVQEVDLAAAIASAHVARYVADFPSAKLAGLRGVISIPHLGASTMEAEDSSAVMASRQLRAFLETGNITNGVNFPDASMPHLGDTRICVMHSNIPHMLARFSSILAGENINIENMLNRSKDEVAYTIIEICGHVPDRVVREISAAESVLRVNLY